MYHQIVFTQFLPGLERAIREMDSIMSSVVAEEDERPASSDAFWGVSPFTTPPKRLRLDSMPNGLEEFELQQENGAVEESFQMEERLDDASAELGLSMVSAIPSSNERVFDLLDELPDEDDDEGEEDDLESSEGEEISQEEIDQLLEKGVDDQMRQEQEEQAEKEKERMKNVVERVRLIVKDYPENPLELLPAGWIKVTHFSGMPIYLHKPTRVCSFSRPYYIGSASVRKHHVPESAIPCLHYRSFKEKEAAAAQEMELVALENGRQLIESGADGNETAQCNGVKAKEDPGGSEPEAGEILDSETEGDQKSQNKEEESQNVVDQEEAKKRLNLPEVKVCSAAEAQKQESLTPADLKAYCQKLFEFKELRTLHFNSWSLRRRHEKEKRREQREIPVLQKDTHILRLPILAARRIGKRRRREFLLNPQGKTCVALLHEYLQMCLDRHPTYTFQEVGNAATPFRATVHIDGMQYGCGYGASKKDAKAAAAQNALEVLIPQFKEHLKKREAKGKQITKDKTDRSVWRLTLGFIFKYCSLTLTFFDEVNIEDTRVMELCNTIGELTPYQVLLSCLQKNYGLGKLDIKSELMTTNTRFNKFTMSVGKHSATVMCRNKREGKQMAAQKILKLLHPYINNWGSLLRLYGTDEVKAARLESHQVTQLQKQAIPHAPNMAILQKLREEMHKIKDVREHFQPIGKFKVPDGVSLPSASSSNLHNINL
ncbi:unnamed protein product [Darwinula stevensoni]|uniref:DRBM domain-containing protein n=1 Tax=Darwinula stevensoni TaxID=69355 RepID=A0A7R8WYD9_9CRUS|nr:unnamed protein product [Darwinula stevensoni]CAG0879257.1 unnamed protein product [Darwinula stevensoni]